MVGQSRGAQGLTGRILRCVHPEQRATWFRERRPGRCSEEADLWVGQGRWKNEGGTPKERETCKAAAGRDDDPGRCESLETFKPVRPFGCKRRMPTPQHRERFSGQLGCPSGTGRAGKQVWKDTSRAPPGGFQQQQL